MRAVSSFSDTCSTSILRLTNGVLAVLCSILVYEIIIHLRPSLDDKKASLHAVILSLYPLHWFFIFLYYTDVASLTAVLAMYLLMLKKKYLLSSLVRNILNLFSSSIFFIIVSLKYTVMLLQPATYNFSLRILFATSLIVSFFIL